MATNPTIHVALDPYDVDPAWDLDRTWSEAEYLKLDTNRLVEFVDGTIEVLPVPTLLHQLIVKYLLFQLDAYVSARGLGTVLPAPFPVFTRETRYREPDLFFLSKKTASEIRLGDASCDHADLVMEVASDDGRRRNLLTKRREYAQARIPEYWIVDPRDESITVLTLGANQKSYTVHGIFQRGRRATSVCLPGFEVEVSEVFDQTPDTLRGTT